MAYAVKCQKYAALFKMSMLHTLRNYKLLLGLCFFEITCLLIFAHLWKVSAARIGAVDLDPKLLLWYIAFNEWILISVPDVEVDIEYELKTGQMAYFLPRPISYLGSKLMEGLGALLLNLTVLGTVAFAFTYWWTGTLPFSAVAFTTFIFLGILAGFLGLVFTMVVGISAFFVDEVEPWRWIWEKLLFVFGGLLLPLMVYPQWMQTIAAWTPFPAILGGRSALIFNFEFNAIAWILLSLTTWSLLGLAILYLLYRQGLKTLSMEGG
jgi:ABC-2 type transport system permease protein